jgi:hypothetical protein
MMSSPRAPPRRLAPKALHFDPQQLSCCPVHPITSLDGQLCLNEDTSASCSVPGRSAAGAVGLVCPVQETGGLDLMSIRFRRQSKRSRSQRENPSPEVPLALSVVGRRRGRLRHGRGGKWTGNYPITPQLQCGVDTRSDQRHSRTATGNGWDDA